MNIVLTLIKMNCVDKPTPCYCGDQPGDIDEVIAGSDLEYESGDFNFKIDAV